MRSLPLRIVKVGGSLIDWPQLGGALRNWLQSEPTATNILIAGGGGAVDAIRTADEQGALGDEAAHWLAIDAMSRTARILAQLIGVELIADYRLQNASPTPSQVFVFDSTRFLREIEPQLPGTTLPASWDVTSDSIAARLAIVLAADELVLLKSQSPPGEHGDAIEPSRLAELAAVNYVDRFLPQLARELPPIRMINLRTAPEQ